jgi:hypothetical protein
MFSGRLTHATFVLSTGSPKRCFLKDTSSDKTAQCHRIGREEREDPIIYLIFYLRNAISGGEIELIGGTKTFLALPGPCQWRLDGLSVYYMRQVNQPQFELFQNTLPVS